MQLQIDVLSAGAIEPGLIAAGKAFGAASGMEVVIEWATTPAIRDKLSAGRTVDILVVPSAAVDDFTAAGQVAEDNGVYLGRVGVGIAVRNGAPLPDISSTEALKRALLDAESVVINRASSGLYMEQLLGELGVKTRIEHKLVRHGNGPQMLQHLIEGKGREFGFCASIEILLYRDRGLQLVGLLPEDIQNYTTYVAVPMCAARNAEGAQRFIDYLATPESRSLFRQHGIE